MAKKQKKKELSEWDIRIKVCDGLADVCKKLAKSTPDKKYSKEFRKKGKVFKALAKLHKSQEKLFKEQQEEKKKVLRNLSQLVKAGRINKSEVRECLKRKRRK